MSEAAKEVKLAGYEAPTDDSEELGASDVSGQNVLAPVRRSNVIKDVPGPDAPLLFKIVPQKRSNGNLEGYWAITTHVHLVGDRDPRNSKNFRSHLCQKTSSQTACSECDKYWEIKNKRKELKKAGKEGTPEDLRLERQEEALKPKQQGWLLVVTPDSPEVKAMRVGVQVLNALFGKAKTKYKPEIPSLITQMIADGNNPYDLKSDTGWIAYSKTGEKMGTTYTVVSASKKEQVVLNNGAKTYADVPVSAKVHPNILKLKRSDLPNLAKIEEKNIWSKEDSDFMAANFRAPDHILEAAQNGGQNEEDEDPLAAESAIGIDDIPQAEGLPTGPTNYTTNSTSGLEAIDNML